RETLLLCPLTQGQKGVYHIESEMKTIGLPIELGFEEVAEVGELSKSDIYVDKETLKFPLQLRKWQNADYFYPFGMQGKKKLSKYFKDEKYSLVDKEQQWLLCDADNHIVWVIGRRPDDRYKVTTQ